MKAIAFIFTGLFITFLSYSQDINNEAVSSTAISTQKESTFEKPALLYTLKLLAKDFSPSTQTFL